MRAPRSQRKPWRSPQNSSHIEQRILGVGGRQRTRVSALQRLAQQIGDGLARNRTAHGRRPLASFTDTGSAMPVSLR